MLLYGTLVRIKAPKWGLIASILVLFLTVEFLKTVKLASLSMAKKVLSRPSKPVILPEVSFMVVFCVI